MLQALRKLIAVVSLGAGVAHGYFNESTDPFELPRNTISAFPQETIHVPTFALELVFEDIRIPGPNGLDLVLRRKWRQFSPIYNPNREYLPNTSFGSNHNIDLARIGSTTIEDCGGSRSLRQIYIPGAGFLTPKGVPSASDLKTGATHYYQNGAVEYLESGIPTVLMPDGIKYTFGQAILQFGFPVPNVLVSRVSDRFGNYIDYNYSLVNGENVLTSMTRSDGASISIQYGTTTTTAGTVHRVMSASYGSRSVSYSYIPTDFSGLTMTDEVGRQSKLESGAMMSTNLKVTLESGLVAEYELSSFADFLFAPGYNLPGTFPLKTRTVSGTNIQTRNWTFERHQLFNLPFGVDPSDPLKLYGKMTETDFEGSLDKETIYRSERRGPCNPIDPNDPAYHGAFHSIETRVGGALKYKLLNSWSLDLNDYVGCNTGPSLECIEQRLDRAEHHIYNSTGTDVFATDYLTYDVYGNVLTSKSSTQSGASKYHRIDFNYDKTNWRIRRPSIAYVSSNGTSWNETEGWTYWNDTGAYKGSLNYYKVETYWLYRNRYYHSNGELKRRIHRDSSQYEEYLSYKRGIPRTMNVAGRYSGTETMSRVVDDYGNVTSETDFNGNTTSFVYDNANRLLTVNFADSAWADEHYYYHPTQNYVRKTKGNYRSYRWWDALYRTILTRTEDLSDITGTRSYVKTTYDKGGRVNFVSHPAAGSSPTNGIVYTYDVLGRRTSEAIAETGTSRTWTYLGGHKSRYQDSLGHQTTTTFESYGVPTYTHPTLIQQPESVTTSITYNLYGNIDLVSQGGVTEDYIYDARQRLCKRVRPDIGHIGFGYDNASRIIWRSHGNTGSTTACGGELLGDRIQYTYDNRGDLRQRTLNGGALVMRQTLDPNGNLTKMESEYGTWDYLINSQNLVEKETLSVNGRTFVLDWVYNSLGHVQSLIYPGGQTVTFSPNALGQPSQAGSYASNADYHLTGQIEQFTYGNGIIRTYDLNAMGMPSEIADFKGSSRRFEHDYVYDAEFNVKNIYDRQNATYHIENMTYDGLHRFKTGNGQWGTTNISYDNKSNITSMQLGGSTINYAYSNNRLTSVSGALNRSYSYDSRSNVSNNGVHTLTFNPANQLTSASGGNYFEYDGHGRRIEKRNGSTTINSVYGLDGKLYHQKEVGGDATNYIYLDGTLLAKEVN